MSHPLSTTGKKTIAAARQLCHGVNQLDPSRSVPWYYNPLEYAWDSHRQYLARYARESCQVLFLGMNPGPWGMAQTGVPFGEVNSVKEFLKIDAQITKPSPEHPKRPVDGLECPRSEVSGRRLWGLFGDKYSTAERFFKHHFVANYCPLVFMEESARNITPDKLPAAFRGELQAVCDKHLSKLIRVLSPAWVVGVGAFAETCAKRVLDQQKTTADVKLGRILHPSPASPAANKDWAGKATRQLQEMGVW